MSSTRDPGAIDLARRYDRISDPQFAHGRDLIDLLAPMAGDQILDVGCGTGRAASLVLERVGAEGRLIGIDPAFARIEVARELRDPRLEFRVGRAEELSAFGASAFDVVYMNSVLGWVQDRPRALAEIHRVLKPGGRLGIATTVRDRRNELWGLRHEANQARRRGPGASEAPDSATHDPAKGSPGEDDTEYGVSMDEVRALLRAAGFQTRVFECRTYLSSFDSVAQIIEFLDATTEGALLRERGPERIASFREALERAIAKTIPGERRRNGIRLERYVLLAVADKAA